MLTKIHQNVERVLETWGLFRHSEGDISLVNEAVGDLLTILMDDSLTIPGADDVKKMFAETSPEKDFDLRNVLPTLCPSLIPLTVLRYVMRRHGVDFVPDETPNWNIFMEKYGSVVVKAIN